VFALELRSQRSPGIFCLGLDLNMVGCEAKSWRDDLTNTDVGSKSDSSLVLHKQPWCARHADFTQRALLASINLLIRIGIPWRDAAASTRLRPV
jgi:hypothetical protein